jgi:aromatic-L-amino-acid/L-tryptophan decarboxylase
LANIESKNVALTQALDEVSFMGSKGAEYLQDIWSGGILSLTHDEMMEIGHSVISIIAKHLSSLSEQPVCRTDSGFNLKNVGFSSVPVEPSKASAVISEVAEALTNKVVPHNHPRFFAFVPSPSNFISVLADALSSGFNVHNGGSLLGSWSTEIELVVLDWLRQIFQFPKSAGGIFVSGGSVANLTALTVARNIKLANKTENATVYMSDQTHFSVKKALHQIGVKDINIRIVKSEDDQRISITDLRKNIEIDKKKGKLPFCIIGNGGTTNCGSIDPLRAIYDICVAENAWFHIDGAYGAAAILDKKKRADLGGLELADSLTIDPHKWMFQPYEIGCLLIRDRDNLRETFRYGAPYISDLTRGAEFNFYEHGIQLTRGFSALKLWMSIKVFGLGAFSDAVTYGIDLSEEAEKILSSMEGWKIMTNARIGILTFRFCRSDHDDRLNDKINQMAVEKICKSGVAYFQNTKVNGAVSIRMCTINPQTSYDDIVKSLKKLDEFCRNL